MQQLIVCSTCLVTLKIRDITEVLHLKKLEIVDRILSKLSVKTDVLVETASLPNLARGTTDEDTMIQTHQIVLSVATYVRGHIELRNVQMNRPSICLSGLFNLRLR